MLQTLIDTHSLLCVYFSVLHALLVNYPSHLSLLQEPSSTSRCRLAQLVADSMSGPEKAGNGSNAQNLDDLRRRLDRLKRVGHNDTPLQHCHVTLTTNVYCTHNIVYVQSILFTSNVYLGIAKLDLLITFIKNILPLTVCTVDDTVPLLAHKTCTWQGRQWSINELRNTTMHQ